MPSAVASLVCAFLIGGLFWLNRDPKVRTSVALWIPVIWVSLACSRSVAQWLKVGPADTTDAALEGSPLDRAIYTGLIVIGLLVLFAPKRRVGRFLWANGPLLLLLLYSAFSLLWSDYPDVGFKRWTKAVGDVVMVLIVLTDPEPAAAFKRLLARVSYFLIPLSVLLIKYYPERGMAYGPWGGKPEFAGVAHNKNNLGVLCLCFGLGALWRLIVDYQNQETPGRSRRITAQCILLSMVLWLFWVTDSMTSLNSFLMGGILLIAANSRVAMRKPSILHVLVLSMLAVSTMVVFLGVSPVVLKAMGRNPTLTDRTEVWGNAFSLVGNPILGTGFESFWLGPRLETLWRIYWWHPNEAHNGYVEIFLQLGWIGVALLALLIVAAYRTVFRAMRRDITAGSIYLAYFYTGVVYNFTEAAFLKILAPAWIFFLFAILGASALQFEPSEQSLPGHSSPPTCELAQPALSEEVV